MKSRVFTHVASFIALMTSAMCVSGLVQAQTQIQDEQKVRVCLSTCVELAQPAKRVIALNWSVIEMLLSLEVEPIGVTQGNGYRKWQSNHPALPENVTEVGRRQEPDLVSIAKLKPDLIIGYNFRHARLHSALSRIAPTLLYQQFPQKSDDVPSDAQNASNPHAKFLYFDAVPSIYSGIAKAVGKSQLAQQKLANMESEINSLKNTLHSAGFAEYPVSYAKFVGMGYGLRVFGPQSVAGTVAQKIGLTYRWQRTLPGKDFTHLQLEQMSELANSHIILADNQTNNDRMLTSPVWSALPFVKASLISQTPALWSFGGPDSILRMAHAFTDSLLEWKATRKTDNQQALTTNTQQGASE
ncbi:ABC transporter substrate-binding protein [Alteromonas sp. a30]|uniref:ABC transporter substrate-binding protein n=1 Tax=Alteromonas sp. a30 TaxID=2730917 RepID=UPI002282142A|nr:iron-siderophore ABC transporter substrate-binding protein [Alteromonas sp. a30]MCY7295226.1 iron-siderophore ABC transporter substrate-binding protein [Alteromonas sp. a30]